MVDPVCLVARLQPGCPQKGEEFQVQARFGRIFKRRIIPSKKLFPTRQGRFKNRVSGQFGRKDNKQEFAQQFTNGLVGKQAVAIELNRRILHRFHIIWGVGKIVKGHRLPPDCCH